MDKRIIPPAHRYYGLRQWTRHSLVLMIAGFVYIGIGIAYAVQKTFGETVSAVQLATAFLPFPFWGALWGFVGVLAIISSRWPPVSRSWGYMALTSMAAGWAALYVVGVIFNGAPIYQLNGALAWGLLAFLWWVISGLLRQRRLSEVDIEPSLATMFVAFVAAVSGFAAQKASVKATKHATDENSRISMEKEAYERARHFDIETITRQSDQITRQAEEIDSLRTEVDELHEKVRVLMAQVRQLESGQTPKGNTNV